VKLEFNVPSSQNAFDLNKYHLAVLKLLKEMDPNMEIVVSREGQDKFSDLLKSPQMKQTAMRYLKTPFLTSNPRTQEKSSSSIL
jgi:hypothetical protein